MQSFRAHLIATSLLLVPLALAAAARQTQVSPDEAIKRAAAGEDKLKAVERDFSYRQDLLVQTMGEGGSVAGQLHRVSDVIYDSLGNRTEKIIEFPPSRLNNFLGVMRPDFASILGVEPFFLTTDNLPRYSIKFVERKKIDEINTYVFDVEPTAKTLDGKPKPGEPRPFKGRIWIDDQDFQIVKAEGRASTLKDDREKFLKFQYYREYVENKFWLPSFVYADDVLDLKRFDLPMRVKITYSDYKRVRPR
jgi:hypothetical protein